MARQPRAPKPLTSTAAFRAYLREADHLTTLVAEGRLSRYRALESRAHLAKILDERLRYLFEARTAQVASPPAAAGPDAGRLNTYVHPARLPDTHQEPGHEEGDRFGYPVADRPAPAEGE